MDETHSTRTRFIHLFSSPITALKGAVAILRRRPGLEQDQLATTLLETIERGVERMQRLSDLIETHASYDDQGVQVQLSASDLPGPYVSWKEASPAGGTKSALLQSYS